MLLKTDNIFHSFEPHDFELHFNSEEKCMAYLAGLKWKDGFTCHKCGFQHSSEGRKPFSRRCSKCKTIESATSHTIFHHCRLPLNIAFKMVYTICNTEDISSWELSRQFGIRQMTCWKQLKKVTDCIHKNNRLCLLQDNVASD